MTYGCNLTCFIGTAAGDAGKKAVTSRLIDGALKLAQGSMGRRAVTPSSLGKMKPLCHALYEQGHYVDYVLMQGWKLRPIVVRILKAEHKWETKKCREDGRPLPAPWNEAAALAPLNINDDRWYYQRWVLAPVTSIQAHCAGALHEVYGLDWAAMKDGTGGQLGTIAAWDSDCKALHLLYTLVYAPESETSWREKLESAKQAYPGFDSKKCRLICDQDKGGAAAMAPPTIVNGKPFYDKVHRMENVRKKGGKAARKVFTKCVSLKNTSAIDEELDGLSDPVREYILRVPKENQFKVHAGAMHNHDSSNVVEGLNAANKHIRGYNFVLSLHMLAKKFEESYLEARDLTYAPAGVALITTGA